jgi:hypothetical protein
MGQINWQTHRVIQTLHNVKLFSPVERWLLHWNCTVSVVPKTVSISTRFKHIVFFQVGKVAEIRVLNYYNCLHFLKKMDSRTNQLFYDLYFLMREITFRFLPGHSRSNRICNLCTVRINCISCMCSVFIPLKSSSRFICLKVLGHSCHGEIQTCG